MDQLGDEEVLKKHFDCRVNDLEIETLYDTYQDSCKKHVDHPDRLKYPWVGNTTFLQSTKFSKSVTFPKSGNFLHSISTFVGKFRNSLKPESPPKFFIFDDADTINIG